MLEGTIAPGCEPIRDEFEALFREGAEVGAALAVTWHGAPVVDLWGGVADVATGRPWARDTRAMVFSVTKGLTAMALSWLAERGQLDWDAPVASVWPEFAANGKAGITFRTLFAHRAGLPVLDRAFTLPEVVAGGPALADALAAQAPVWTPGDAQGYHAVTYGLYASEVVRRISGGSIGALLQREFFGPLGAEVTLGTPPEHDGAMATLLPPTMGDRVLGMLGNLAAGNPTELYVLLASLAPGRVPLRAFTNPDVASPADYSVPAVWRSELAWASATATARGVARAYVPLAVGGEVDGRRYLAEATIRALYARESWATRDRVLQKPLGWTRGFLKDEVFSPVPEAFGHAGLGGSLGWCDPVNQITIGYVPNKLAAQVRSPRILRLCKVIHATLAGS